MKYFFILLSLLLAQSSTQAQGVFKTYPQATANYNYFGTDIIKTADGNFLILSNISSYDTSGISFHGSFVGYALTKVTPLGDTIWTGEKIGFISTGNGGSTSPVFVSENPDSSFSIFSFNFEDAGPCGTNFSGLPSYRAGFVSQMTKFDSNGNFISHNPVLGDCFNGRLRVTRLPSNNYLTYSKHIDENNNEYLRITIIDSDGNIINENSLQTTASFGQEILHRFGNRYLIFSLFGNSVYDVNISNLQITQLHNFIQTSYNITELNDAIKLHDGNLLLYVDYLDINSITQSEIIKIDINGNIIFSIPLPVSSIYRPLHITEDNTNRLYLGYSEEDTTTNEYNIFVDVLDANGQYLYTKTINRTPENEFFGDAIFDSNNELIIVGGEHCCSNTSSPNSTFWYKDSVAVTNTNEINQLTGINIFPNPTKDFFNIELEEIKDDLQFTVIDVNGRIIIQQSITKSTTTINTSNLSAGIYFYKIISNGGKTKSGKLLIQP